MGIPKESGLLSLWLATLIYALFKVKEWNYFILSSLIGSMVLLLMSDEVLSLIAKRRTRRLIKLLSVILIPYIPSLLMNPAILLVGIVAALFISIIFLSTSPSKEVSHGSTIAGSAAVSMHSIILMISGGALSPADLLLPPLYSIMSTSHASIRVLGHNTLALLSGATAGILLLIITLPSPSLQVIMLLDIVSRLIQEITGLSSRIKVRAFGFLELARSCLTLSASGLIG